jgi:hypothetical protein
LRSGLVYVGMRELPVGPTLEMFPSSGTA